MAEAITTVVVDGNKRDMEKTLGLKDNYKYDKQRIIAAAINYAKNGIAVVPLLGNDPLFPGKPLFYVKDPTEVQRIYRESDQDLNVGMALGSPSGVVAIATSESPEMQNGYRSYARAVDMALTQARTVLRFSAPRALSPA